MAPDFRALPSVDALAAELDAPHGEAVLAARIAIGLRRQELADGALGDVDLTARAAQLLVSWRRSSLRRVLNATGVIVHTGLGRAPLAEAARDAVVQAAEGYSNLEFDLFTGARGSRHDHVQDLLQGLTGAEAAMVVNNCAGAVLLCAAALAQGREIVISRGQLIEIGGGFRVPEVVAQAGSRLVEVGTTNRTRLADYAAAIGADTGAILRAHPSNFRQLGFVEDVGTAELCTLGIPVIDDVGSGALGPLHDEPDVRGSVAAGAALVCFSGDKLLGGPQAGLIVGTEHAVEYCRRHPLARALRIDKLSLAALEATLRVHERAPETIPVRAMLEGTGSVERAARLHAALPGSEIVEAIGKVGGGALPLLELPGPAVALRREGVSADDLVARLRTGDPAVLARIADGRVLLDPRTLTDAEAEQVAEAVLRATSA